MYMLDLRCCCRFAKVVCFSCCVLLGVLAEFVGLRVRLYGG